MTGGARRIDCLVEMLEELRCARLAVPLFDADGREAWVDAVAQLVRALPQRDQQWAWVCLIANDICHTVPGLSLACAAAWVQARLKLQRES